MVTIYGQGLKSLEIEMRGAFRLMASVGCNFDLIIRVTLAGAHCDAMSLGSRVLPNPAHM